MDLEELNRRLEDHEVRLKKVEQHFDSSENTPSPKKEESLREFINRYHLKSDLDKTLILIYYFEEIKGLEEVSSKEISEGFKEIREKIPKNIQDKFSKLAKKGYIQENKPATNKNKCWTYTNSGLGYLEGLKNDGQ